MASLAWALEHFKDLRSISDRGGIPTVYSVSIPTLTADIKEGTKELRHMDTYSRKKQVTKIFTLRLLTEHLDASKVDKVYSYFVWGTSKGRFFF